VNKFFIFKSALIGLFLSHYSVAACAETEKPQNCTKLEKKADNKEEKESSEAEEKKSNGKEKKEGDAKTKKDDKDENKVESVKIGNLSLPSSQQPGPLFSFGQNIIDKGQKQFFALIDDYGGTKRYEFDVVPSILYGISDDFSIFFNAPYGSALRMNENYSSGWEDLFLQFEWAFYTKTRKYYGHQATLVANVTFPTGSIKKHPETGYGAPAYFLGATFSHLAVDWYFFTSEGVVIPRPAAGDRSTGKPPSFFVTQFGKDYQYQLGFGRNIPSPPGWIYLWMVEIDGEFAERNKINGVIDPNSGGNTIYILPSIWISNKDLLFQLGIGYPVVQNLYGNQPKFKYQLGFNLGWTF